jgi:hypothetical protein
VKVKPHYILIIFCIFVTFIYIIPRITKAQGTVSEALAKKAALYYAEQLYGEVHVFTVEKYYDLANQPLLYSVVLFRGQGALPSIQSIKDRIWEQAALIEKLKNEYEEIESKNISGKKKAMLQAKKWQEIQDAGRIMSGQDEFVTAYVSASEEKIPVPRLSDGLPDTWLMLPNMKSALQKKGESFSGEIQRVYCRGLYHFLMVQEGDRSALLAEGHEVSAFDLKKKCIVKVVLKSAKQSRDVDSETAKQFDENLNKEQHQKLVKQRWDFIKDLPDLK